MSIIKNVVIEAMSTHPGFLKLSLYNPDGTLACDTIMNVGTAKQIAKDIEDHAGIASRLLNDLQSIIVRESLNGSFGDGMKDWAQKGGYDYNKKQEVGNV